jgi:hypothetical protein
MPPNADGRAKLAIFIALTATSERHCVPRFMINKGLTWRGTKKGRDHVRMDLMEGWKHMANVCVAIARRYGASHRLASLILGEYYPSTVADRPRGFDFNLYRQNAKLLWQDIIAECPRNGRGNRLNVMQSNPITSGGHVTPADIASIGVGMTGSDPPLFTNECGEPNNALGDVNSIQHARQENWGKVPLQHQGNAAVFREADTSTSGRASPTRSATPPVRWYPSRWSRWFGTSAPRAWFP